MEPLEHGLLDVGDGDRVFWEVCGDPLGRPAVVLHGGPGSGCSAWFRELFDPRAYRVVLFDQRNCGRSTPHAGAPGIDLANNTTASLVADIERLREHLEIERWLVLGGSWGSTLALAYAESHAERVTEMVLFGVTTGRHSEFDWTFRGGVGVLFPEQWERLRAALPAALRDADVVEAYHRLLNDPDPEVCRRAAEAWCLWESATPEWPPSDRLAKRFTDPALRSHSRGSSPTTCAITHGSTTEACCAAPKCSPTSRASSSTAASTSPRRWATPGRSSGRGREPNWWSSTTPATVRARASPRSCSTRPTGLRRSDWTVTAALPR